MSLANDTIRHQIYLQRLATQIYREYGLLSVNESYRQARLIMLDAENIGSVTKLNRVLRDIRKTVTQTMAKGWEGATKALEELALYEAGFAAKLTAGYIAADIATPSMRKIRSFMEDSLLVLGSGSQLKTGTWAEFVNNNVGVTVAQYQNTIRAGYIQGQTVGQMTRSLRTYAKGLNAQQVETLARTGMQHYAQNAREIMARENSDVLKFRIYNATLDNRTTSLCAGRDGETWAIEDDSYPRLPAHFNCRSVYLYSDKQERTGTRASVGGKGGEPAPGQVRGSTSYEQFFKNQPKWWQDEALGATRAKLVREGGMSISSFNDLTGRQLTLDQLRNLDAEAFRRAGLG